MNEYNYNNDNNKYDHYYDYYNNNRYLAGSGEEDDYKNKKGPTKIDYNVLSVAAMTLALIMMVEVIRHKLDHMALSRPFYRTVLEGVYTELATLGIVEFFLYLLSEYYKDYDKARKEVFGDVHFLLFYTAILNALQSVIINVVSMRTANKIWIQIETLQLNHYIEIREEFQRVTTELNLLRNKGHGNNNSNTSSSNNNNNINNNSYSNNNSNNNDHNNNSNDSNTKKLDNIVEENGENNNIIIDHNSNNNVLDEEQGNTKLMNGEKEESLNIDNSYNHNETHSNNNNNHKQEESTNNSIGTTSTSVVATADNGLTSFSNIIQYIYDYIRYPHLQRKYNNLLVQIRFHELRVHFLQSYNLPLKLKISDYLINSQKVVLIKLVHVSSSAWLLLTGAVLILYYTLGMVFYKFSSQTLVGTALTWIFFCTNFIFIILSYLLLNKMTSIFRAIMHEKTLWDIHDDNDHDDKNKREKLAQQQRMLFWGNEPKLVITAIQFMQFGYAVAISTLIIYWKEINDGTVHMIWYLLSICVCYTIFVRVTGYSIPRYTLCTSLGQLVDEQRLRETVALYKLEEAKQKQLDLLEEYQNNYDNNYNNHDNLVQEYLDKENQQQQKHNQDYNNITTTTKDNHNKNINPSSSLELPDEEKPIIEQHNTTTPTTTTAIMIRPPQPQQTTTVVPNDLAGLPPIVEPVHHNDNDNNVHKAEEEGSESSTFAPRSSLAGFDRQRLSHAEGARIRKLRRKMASDGVALMTTINHHDPFQQQQHYLPQPPSSSIFTSSDSWNPPPSSLPSAPVPPPLHAKDDFDSDYARTQRQRRHRSRKKSVSDGVAFMAQVQESEERNSPLNDKFDLLQKRSFTKLATIQDSPHKHKQTTKLDSGDLMAELVKLDTESLRAKLPEKEQKRLQLREDAKQKRRNRRKTVSDGVAAMAAMAGTKISTAAGRALGTADSPTSKKQQQLNVQDDSNLGWMAKSREGGGGVDGSSELSLPRQRPDRRTHMRRRSVSDGVAAMAAMKLGTSLFTVHSHDEAISIAPTTSDGILISDTKPSPIESENAALNTSQEMVEILENNDKGDDKVRFAEPSTHGSDVMDDGHSDIDDVPKTSPSVSTKMIRESPPFRVTISELARSYFVGKKYLVISDVFGTFVAFFLVGERVESFIHTEAIISEDFISMYVPNELSFWLLSVWLMLFLCASGIILVVFQKPESRREKQLVVAAMLDIILSSICLIVLFVAESKRCCNPSSDDYNKRYRVLAEAYYDADYENDDAESGPAPCSCPKFGSRLYGGLGTIEPYTSIICLRALRHLIARKIIIHFKLYEKETSESAPDPSSHSSRDAEDVIQHLTNPHDDHHHTAKHHGSADPAVVVAQVWEATIGQNPDLVAKYGEFSGEILQAMLGVSVFNRVQSDVQNNDNQDFDIRAEKVGTDTKSYSLNEQFAGLSPEAQEVILAGKLGRTVVRSASQLNLVASFDNSTEPAPGSPGGLENPTAGNIRFEISTAISSDEGQIFRGPNARLLRSMRRCDKKLLPYLDHWTTVDVVITKFEMVYFDANGVDDCIFDGAPEGTRQALVATKGGKGLRLCDVALGRRVVGRLLLDEICTINVERKNPQVGSILMGDCPDVEVVKTEFWRVSDNSSLKRSATGMTRGSEWSTVKQDILTIVTSHGHTLYLRFYADFEDAFAHPDRLANEDEEHGFINKNNAFQWAQTIGRICGSEQLKQNLPHFGDDTSEELRDYLQITHSAPESKRYFRSKSGEFGRHHRRASLTKSPFSSRKQHKIHSRVSSEMDLASMMMNVEEGNNSNNNNAADGEDNIKQEGKKKVMTRTVSFS